jgi:hypothetical protein
MIFDIFGGFKSTPDSRTSPRVWSRCRKSFGGSCVSLVDDIVPKMGREGLQTYYTQKIEELEVVLREKEQNVRRLEAQRNEWNAKGSNSDHIIRFRKPFSKGWVSNFARQRC